MSGVQKVLCGTGEFAGCEVAMRVWVAVATLSAKKNFNYREPLECKIEKNSKAY